MKRILAVLSFSAALVFFLAACYVEPMYSYDIDFVIRGTGEINMADISVGFMDTYYYDYADYEEYYNVPIIPAADFDFWAETGDYLYLYARNTSGSSNGELSIEVYANGFMVASSSTSEIDGEVEIYYYLD